MSQTFSAAICNYYLICYCKDFLYFYNVLFMTTFDSRKSTNTELINLLFVQGIRRIDLALAAAAQQLSQSRPTAAKIVVLITTGLQAQVFGMTPLDEASQPLRDANANVLVIGIGKEPDIRELNLITKNPKVVEIIPTPDEVIVSVHLLSRQLRQDANRGRRTNLFPLF